MIVGRMANQNGAKRNLSGRRDEAQNADGANPNSRSRAPWPVLRQILDRDIYGLNGTAASERTEQLRARTVTADKVVGSVCPYCAVGCGQLVYIKNNRIIDIEGDPASPISHGNLCPKGAATFQLVTGSHRENGVLYRRPHGTEWEQIPLDRALDMVAERMKKTRDANWEDKSEKGE